MLPLFFYHRISSPLTSPCLSGTFLFEDVVPPLQQNNKIVIPQPGSLGTTWDHLAEVHSRVLDSSDVRQILSVSSKVMGLG